MKIIINVDEEKIDSIMALEAINQLKFDWFKNLTLKDELQERLEEIFVILEYLIINKNIVLDIRDFEIGIYNMTNMEENDDSECKNWILIEIKDEKNFCFTDEISREEIYPFTQKRELIGIILTRILNWNTNDSHIKTNTLED